MRLSEFRRAVADEFGAYGAVVTRDPVLTELGGRTAEEALAAGVPPREVWFAICRAEDIPDARRHGVGRGPAKD